MYPSARQSLSQLLNRSANFKHNAYAPGVRNFLAQDLVAIEWGSVGGDQFPDPSRRAVRKLASIIKLMQRQQLARRFDLDGHSSSQP